MDGDYPERIQFNDPELDAFNVEDEEEEVPGDEYEQLRYSTEAKGFDINVDESEKKGSVDHHPRRDFSAGKLFVGGISWETTQETFSNYFSKYGEITDSIIMTDKQSGRPRGFGFVTFIDSGAIDKVLEKEHVIDGKAVEVKRTVPKEHMQVKGILKTKKIFVGGIPPSCSEDELKEHFSVYGGIIEHQIMFDHQTGRSRGFGFVTFDSEDAVEMIYTEGKTHELGGKQVEIKKAEPKRGFADHSNNARSFGGSNGGAASFGGGYSSVGGSGYGGNKDNGYGAYGTYGGYGGGGSAGFYGGYGGGYGYGYGFGGVPYGNTAFAGAGYGMSGGYGFASGYAAAAAAGYGIGKGYGGAWAGYGAGAGGGYSTGSGFSTGGRFSNGTRGGYSNGGARGGYGGRGGGGGDEASTESGRYHPYQR